MLGLNFKNFDNLKLFRLWLSLFDHHALPCEHVVIAVHGFICSLFTGVPFFRPLQQKQRPVPRRPAMGSLRAPLWAGRGWGAVIA